MNKTEIEHLLTGETLEIEYKDNSKKDFSDDLIIKACVGMANARGGIILVGVSDDGHIIGDVRAKSGDENKLEYMIRERTRPSVDTNVIFFNYDDKIVTLINVKKSYNVVSTTGGAFFIRQLNSRGEPENRPMNLDDIFKGTSRFGIYDLSAETLSGLSIDDIDLDLVKSVSSNILQKNPSEAEEEIFNKEPIEILKSLGLFRIDTIPNIAALLLFGKEASIQDRIPNHFVQYQVFGETGQILKNEKYYLPIVKLLPKLLDEPELMKNSDEFILNGQSIVIPEYSKDALREAFANALVHRDYTTHSGIQIQVYPNELKVSSAGGFLDGINIDNLLTVPPTPRNRRLSEAMMKMKYVETSGRGIDIIYYSQARYGRPAPDYSMTTNNSVVVRLVGGKANLDFCRLIFSLGIPSLPEMLILNALFYQRSMSLTEIMKLIQVSDTVTKPILNELIKKNWIEILDEANPLYLLKGAIRKSKNRISKNNIENIKEKILNLLKEHNYLGKQEIASVLNLTEPQIYRVLKVLEKENKIVLNGKNWNINKDNV